MLGEAKIVFSASLQETLGIGCYEGALVGAIPMVPDRLSYSEMYFDNFKYPSDWTSSWDNYIKNRQALILFIMQNVDFYDSRRTLLAQQAESLTTHFFSADALINNLKEQ